MKCKEGCSCGRHIHIVSDETRYRMSMASKGKAKPKGWINPVLKGSKRSEEVKLKISEAKKGKPVKFVPDNTGRTVSVETRQKLSNIMKSKGIKPPGRKTDVKGSNNGNWKGGITLLNTTIRKSNEYKLWRVTVFERDKYTCVWCGVRGGTLQADHIKSFAGFPELRFDLDNGRTLCIKCHRKTDTYGGRGKRCEF